ncbi:MAG: PAC2 family protein [archaeon]|nr:PAC2 family protein [archaeon]MDD2477803.1 PAC2 family protein [Candidatus ainarchaeum sp.]MDD3084685.1 PAC2 family protein [Candidatus ainarchaeum sp.]MDD4221231.1 PAC2 family protein [Candidatus ainarchaeum sp.]
MVTNIDIVKKLKRKLKDPVLFVGLPGIGLVGKIAIDYLVKELNPKPNLFAKIYSDTFPPAVHVKNSILEAITDDFYLYSLNQRDYLFLVGPVQPPLGNILNSFQHYEFSEKIAEFAKKLNIKEIYTFAGLNVGDRRIVEAPKVYAVCSDEKIKNSLTTKRIKDLIFEKNNKDTLISGVSGLLPGISYYKYNISGVCIMGETNGRLTFGDHGSAKKTLEIISKLFPQLKFDLKKINEDAKKIEQSFNLISKKIDSISKKEDSPSNYIR